MDAILIGLQAIFTPQALLLILAGTFIGIIFGAIPGLTATMAVALCLPMTYTLSVYSSMAFLLGLYIGGISGGLISAILLKIPGTPSSLATTFDGHPMAEKGQAGKALDTGIWASFWGGLFSFIVLFFIAPWLANISINFTPYDYFSVILFSLTMISSLAGKDMKKGIAAGLIGILLAFVGSDPIDGLTRFTFGNHSFDSGFDSLPVVIGLFAVTEVYEFALIAYASKKQTRIEYDVNDSRLRLSDLKGEAGNFIQSWLIGLGIGILPGIGGGISNLLAYTYSKKRSKHPELYGTGYVGGVIASETANNSTIGGALVPLLALGIPGDAITAVLIAGFMIHGISPGPTLFRMQKELVYAIFASIIIANFVMLILMLSGKKIFTKILKINKAILLPIVIAICVIGAFANNNRMFDVYVVLIFGIIGILFKIFDYPVSPLIMGLLLGPNLEIYFRRSLMFSGGSFLPFITNPVSLVFLLLSVLSIVLAVLGHRKKKA